MAFALAEAGADIVLIQVCPSMPMSRHVAGDS
jgi:hypothetical protein